nr:hypothetical protein [Halorubrum sp. BOL3-1]
MEADGLTHTLDFQLNIREGDPSLLTDGTLESRRVVNEIFRLDKEGGIGTISRMLSLTAATT